LKPKNAAADPGKVICAQYDMVWCDRFSCRLYNQLLSLRKFHVRAFGGTYAAMSALPEEIPVAFSAFQALGAFRLLRHNIIVKQPQFVETLGSTTLYALIKQVPLLKTK
jgi:Ca2+-transporting ATPase